MKRVIKILILFVSLIALLLSVSITAFAHSGRTDSNGGHKDNKNISGLGSYHYHCGGYPAHLHTKGYCPYRDVFPKSVSISAGKKTLGIGETTSISATVSPSNACDTSVSLSSSDTSVVRISSGKLQAVGFGTATITATSFNGKTATVKITVKEITADKVTISSNWDMDEPLYLGTTKKLVAQITPENVDNPTIVWSSSDKSIVSVDGQGNIKGLAEGKATIYATASNGVAGKVTISVKEKYVERVEISEETLNLLLQDTYKLKATVTPSDATFPKITWASDDPSIVTVSSDGRVVAVGCGTALVTATSTNGIVDSVEITVSEVVAEMIEILGETDVYLNESSFLKVKLTPADTTIKDIIWSTSDQSVATIDEDGTLKCLGVGFVTITATQKDVTTSIQIEVKIKPVAQVEILSSSDLTDRYDIDETICLSATVYPSDATYREVSWSSSDPTIAEVDDFGVVTIKSRGKVLITACTPEGIKASCEIHAGSSLVGAAIAGTVVLLAGVFGISRIKSKKNK